MGWLVSNYVVAEGCAGWAGARELEVWLYDPGFGTEGAMLDGIALGNDGSLDVDTYEGLRTSHEGGWSRGESHAPGDRPAALERPSSACGLGSCGPLRPGSAAGKASRLTGNGRRSR